MSEIIKEEEKKSRINIQWYPGHMTKAKREMQEKIKIVDLVIELRDARIPDASKNPMIHELCQNKPRLIVLTKKDKADLNETKRWIKKLSNENTKVIAIDVLSENFTKKIVEASSELMKDMLERRKRKGLRPRALRAMVVGIPNVGKSTFINRLVKRKITTTGNRPGVTKSLQWVKVLDTLELLDTPGVLWPKFEDEKVGILLAITGAIRDEVLPLEDIALWAMRHLIERYPQALVDRYKVELNEDAVQMFEAIALKKCYMRNGEMDYKRCVDMLINDIRNDKFGAITWELSDEVC